jgi:hypothetical protein
MPKSRRSGRGRGERSGLQGDSAEDLAAQLLEFGRNRDASCARGHEIARWYVERHSIELTTNHAPEALEGPGGA